MQKPTFEQAQTVTLILDTGSSCDGLEVVSATDQDVELKSHAFGYTIKLGWSPVVKQWIVVSPQPIDRLTVPARVSHVVKL